MKRWASMILAALLLLTCVLAGTPKAHASGKINESRAIAIVFDNSGSMYVNGNPAWSQAIYAMEVFASMLNKGDTLLIYPMNPIKLGKNGQEYSLEKPYKVTEAKAATAIKDFYTPSQGNTPIESVDSAAEGIRQVQADKKYLIVLSDGTYFHKGNNVQMSKPESTKELDDRFQKYADKDLTVMYLGIGKEVIDPQTKSEYFVKRTAGSSDGVRSALTELCNLIFGRDTLPPNHLNGNKVDFDISLSKLIVFVQGKDVSDLNVTGASGSVGKLVDKIDVSVTADNEGTGNWTSTKVDGSLQGSIVTYEDCPAGSYTINYKGEATSVEVYYEPDVKLDFVFTDVEGKAVPPEELYQGDYKVSFGLKDAKTEKLISSDLLGNPHYQGSYSINGQKTPISSDGYSGEVAMTLKEGDKVNAELTVTFLNGYILSQDSSGFGWPPDGIHVKSIPAEKLQLAISGGADRYSLQALESGEPFIAKVYYGGQQLTGEALESVELKWDPQTSNAEVKQEFAGDHYKLTLHYKDPSAPEATVCGECTVPITAVYKADGASAAQTEANLTYNINDDFSPLQMKLIAPEDYIVISELEESKEITVELTLNGVPLTEAEFGRVELEVDSKINYTKTGNPGTSSYTIKLHSTEGIGEGNYRIGFKAIFTDQLGRTEQTEDSLTITLSNVPLWVRWLVGSLLFLLLILLILLILHIRVMPKNVKINTKESVMVFGGRDVTKFATFGVTMTKGQMRLFSAYNSKRVDVTMEVKPGKESYLKKPKFRRTAEVNSSSVRVNGANIKELSIDSVNYELNKATGKLERIPKRDTPFNLKNGSVISYSGTISQAGVPKPFRVSAKLNFKKK